MDGPHVITSPSTYNQNDNHFFLQKQNLTFSSKVYLLVERVTDSVFVFHLTTCEDYTTTYMYTIMLIKNLADVME